MPIVHMMPPSLFPLPPGAPACPPFGCTLVWQMRPTAWQAASQGTECALFCDHVIMQRFFKLRMLAQVAVLLARLPIMVVGGVGIPPCPNM